jgi:hypothetical protein
MDQGHQQGEQVPSVASRVLSTFVDAVAEDPELADVTARLRQTLLERKSLTEASLRHALFGDADV